MLIERIERLFEEYKEKARLELQEEERLKARLEVQEEVRVEGRMEGMRQALALILKARFGTSTTRVARIAALLDEGVLTSALERAAVAEHEDAVFAHLD